MSPPSPAIAIVGLGPRGISVVERLAALIEPGTELTLHLIDEAQHGAGRVWDTTQTRTLCMNTLSAAVTLFTEPGSSVKAPVVEGPILHDWIRHLRGEEINPAAAALLAQHPPAPEVAEAFAEEIAVTRPESNPSRALYGAYLRWVLDVALARLPESVQVIAHHSRAVELQETDGARDRITLADGTTVTADATVLALGWHQPGPTHEENLLAESGLTWIRPGNPLEQPVEQIPAEGTVLVRGLGMGFFDVMALLTFDRGGQFHEDPEARSGLRYEASGREPHLVVTSHRGYPYLPKSEYHALPPAAELRRLKAAIARLQGAERIDFDTQVWPAVIADAYEAYYATLARVRPGAVDLPTTEFAELLDALVAAGNITGDLRGVDKLLAAHSREPFSLRTWLEPLAGVTGTRAELTAHIADRMAGDIHEATLGLDSPAKAALWSISASRKPTAILGAQDRYTFESRRNLHATMMSLGQMVGSGPPLFRTRQLLALVDAGLVSFLGANPKIRVTGGEFVATSPTTNKAEVRSPVLVDAWMHSPDVRRRADPLALSIAGAGRSRAYHLSTSDGQRIASGSPEVDPASRLLIRADGSTDPRLSLIGIPTWGQLPDTTISPMPGTDALMLQETDAAARTALATALG
ncbi:FAD/NAD(P)-binding protein [Corynebacterium sp. YIM 101645]|uniref:FAD/NAD(P)-binding protein n=1 Tax=Corynebacterium lemuris TaxID=1859292 RepID=A0ABT2G217_9CORY|nr:FAD/NAD(P)-binding protein [Corynebacterium lemuris]MCS5480337.1 FAD/NAD(P)-binding protein [Corynebacterium lemuris]